MANVESSRMNADELTAQCLQMKFVQLESVHARFCQSFVDRLIARREKESAAKLAHVESTLIDLNEKFVDSSKLKRHYLTDIGQKDFICPHPGCGVVGGTRMV
ncbi:hypothetical protein BS78_01G325500 [Paspalum vaginatum]|nr:hypothetical protein BS78_01G325500 [Paspalum vaginatum]